MSESLDFSAMAAAGLAQAIRAFNLGPVLADRSRHILWNVNPRGEVLGRSLDEVIGEASQVLLQSGRVYRYGDEIVLEHVDPDGASLAPLAANRRAEPGADAVLSNLMAVDAGNGQNAVQAAFPPRLARSLLADELLWRSLPTIRLYSHRPVFDQDYGLCGPGYHPESGILVHGPAVTPILHEPTTDPSARAIDRFPPRVGELFSEFCWRSEADLVNTLGYLLGGFLISNFITVPHPVALVDGNQPNIGKTLVLQAVACVLDGTVPPPIDLVRDEELAKRLGAELRDGRSSMILLDNLRGRLASSLIEANALAPVLSFRILGQSATIQRPNTYLWGVTSNGTEASPDLVSRAVPIRLFFEGDPKPREFRADVIELALEHRLEILGELAGMVQRWIQQGAPSGRQRHRCRGWAATIGGILDVAGLGGHFLANADEAACEMDESLGELSALATYVAKSAEYKDLLHDAGTSPAGRGRVPSDWAEIFLHARVRQDKLAMASDRSRATIIGQFLGAKVGRTTIVETADGHLDVTLRKRAERARKNYFYFEVSRANGPEPDPSDPSAPPETGGGIVAPASETIPSARVTRPPCASQPGAPSALPAGLDWV